MLRRVRCLSTLSIKAELRLQHQREQNREARQFRHKELEKNARDVRTFHSLSASLIVPFNITFLPVQDTVGSNSEVTRIYLEAEEDDEEEEEEVTISRR